MLLHVIGSFFPIGSGSEWGMKRYEKRSRLAQRKKIIPSEKQPFICKHVSAPDQKSAGDKAFTNSNAHDDAMCGI
jgi:hypothetical protein